MIPSGTTRGERASPTSSRSTTSQSYATQHLANGFIYISVIALTVGTRASVFVGIPSGVAVLLRVIAVGAAMCALHGRFRRLTWGCLLVVGLAGGSGALQHVQTPRLGVYQGAAKVMEDPQWRSGAVQCVLSLEGQRFIVYAYGLEGRRLNGRQVGEVVEVSALRQRLDPGKQSRYRSRHIVGVATLIGVSETAGAGAPLYRSANRLRGVLQRSTRFMPYEEASLYMGLLIGDDREQTKEMIAAFRGSGLSHLTAVSGQNVAFLLAVAAPLLVRVKSRWRLIATMFLLGWFVVLTRAEPSVVRATTMAALSAYGIARGRDVPPMRIMAIALGALLLIDPLIAWSVGFWMSSFATAGLIMLTPIIANFLPGPPWLSGVLSTTLGAQLGVMPITLFVFGSAPIVAIATNLLAVPIAGAVMLVGLPMGLVVGVLSEFGLLSPVCGLLMLPITFAVRWVWWVAVVGEAVQPGGLVNAALWLIVVCLATCRCFFLARRTHLTE
jgi:competence protein ComEC